MAGVAHPCHMAPLVVRCSLISDVALNVHRVVAETGGDEHDGGTQLSLRPMLAAARSRRVSAAMEVRHQQRSVQRVKSGSVA